MTKAEKELTKIKEAKTLEELRDATEAAFRLLAKAAQQNTRDISNLQIYRTDIPIGSK